jgi:cell filamentation protein
MDPYVYPENDVLRNRRGIRDSAQLQRFEAPASGRRLLELEARPLAGSLDTPHLRDLHRYIFQDVYRWAGEFRTVNIARSGQFPYAFPDRIESSLNRVFAELRNERILASLDVGSFAGRAAHYLGEINAVHPFREGNGRTQRAFVSELARRNGYALDWSRTSREQVYKASRLSFQHGDNAGLKSILSSALRRQKSDQKQPGNAPAASRDTPGHDVSPAERAKELAAALKEKAHGIDRGHDDDREK